MGSSAVYESNGVLQADWIDDRGNLVHQWWNPGGGWVVEVVAGPDGASESKTPASAAWGVTWILGAFDEANRIDLWTVSEDHSRSIHAWASPGAGWHSEDFVSRPGTRGADEDEVAVEVVEVEEDDGGRRRLRD